jgi:hypothetical protein
MWLAGLGMLCFWGIALLLFLVWTAFIYSIRPKHFYGIWIGVPVVGIIVLISYTEPFFLKEAPPRTSLCGSWAIDSSRTTWRAAKELLATGEIDPQRGHLEIASDERFVINDLPDFSFEAGGTGFIPHQSGRGIWWLGHNGGDNNAYIWLEFSEIDGKPTKDKHAALYFRKETGRYFLDAVIWDPDSGDDLVLRRVK